MEDNKLKLFEIELTYNADRKRWFGTLGDLFIAVYPMDYSQKNFPDMKPELRSELQVQRAYHAKMSVKSDQMTFGHPLIGRTVGVAFGTSPEHAAKNLEGRLRFFHTNISAALAATPKEVRE